MKNHEQNNEQNNEKNEKNDEEETSKKQSFVDWKPIFGVVGNIFNNEVVVASHVLCSGSGEELEVPFTIKLSWILQVAFFFCSKGFKSPGPSEGSQLIVYSLQWCWVTIHINY